MLVAESTNRQQMEHLASRARVVLTTAGPFALYGNGVVDACVKAGAHYVDVTGETAWVRSLIDRHHERTAGEGTRIIPFCGFDSVPADIGVSLLAKQLGANLTEAKAYFELKGGSPNGGTVATGLNAYSSGAAERMLEPFLLSPGKSRSLHPIEKDPTSAAYDQDVESWVAPCPMGIIDTRVVRRTCSLSGIDVAFQEFRILKGFLAPVRAFGIATGAALLSKAMRFSSFRNIARRSAQSGSGPSVKAMESGWFRCRFWGRNSDGRTAEVVLAGNGDPANRITVKCVCESALALACDSTTLPTRSGVLTPSYGLGDALVNRLREREITISTETAA